MSGLYVLQAKTNQPCELVYILIVLNYTNQEELKWKIKWSKHISNWTHTIKCYKKKEQLYFKILFICRNSEKKISSISLYLKFKYKTAFSYSYIQNSIKIIFTENKSFRQKFLPFYFFWVKW